MPLTKEYREQLQKEHDGSKWGTTGARYCGDKVLQLLKDRPYIETVLDFGAGKQELGLYIRQNGHQNLKWTNYDPGIPGIDKLPEGKFDLVITTDVLEHVEPDALDDTIKYLELLTGKVLFSDIACYETGKVFGEGPYKGKDLHLIVEEPSWWRAKFSSLIALKEHSYAHTEKQSKGKMKARCVMVHEKV